MTRMKLVSISKGFLIKLKTIPPQEEDTEVVSVRKVGLVNLP